MPPLYEFSRKVIHNGSQVAGDVVIDIETPPQRWAYAVTVPADSDSNLADGRVLTKLQVRVQQGVVGVGVLSHDESRMVKEVGLAGPTEWTDVNLLTKEREENGPLVIRNLSGAGTPSLASVRIVDSIAIADDDDDAGLPPLPEVVVDPKIFDGFAPWSGRIPAGYWTDWTGTLTRADVWAFPPEVVEIYSKERFQETELPLYNEHALDWVPLIQALQNSKGTFRMAALGAGWGRWISGGAALARQLGRDYRLLGVEAEPQHFEWMGRHMRDNGIDQDHAILLNAAAVGQPGDCWFNVGNSQAWYGQSVVSADEAAGKAADGQEGQMRRVQGVTIKDVLAHLSPIDYLHMDIQGTEAEFLRYAPEELNKSVRMINIGTHGLDIEAELRALFRAHGWTNVYDVAMGSTHIVRVGDDRRLPVEFGDGVQVWLNPRLAG